ncbi:MAG: molybdenum cofactor guanylyltransferase [Chloroflexi bacterium]|nr:molybdenum cofactor guanylyltransferase [Chloroflexota bacterium]
MNIQNYSSPELPVSIVILAGGRGERIGQDKATLLLEGVPLIQRGVSTALQLSDDVICVARADQDITVKGAAVVHDPPGNRGVLPAIFVGLEHARNDWVFLMACDMPFIQLPLVRYMLSLRQEYTIVVPKLSVGLEPFHALYHRKVVPSLRTAIAQNKMRVISFYTGQNIREVSENEIKLYDPHLISFFNINTADDFIRAQHWA